MDEIQIRLETNRVDGVEESKDAERTNITHVPEVNEAPSPQMTEAKKPSEVQMTPLVLLPKAPNYGLPEDSKLAATIYEHYSNKK